MKNFFIKSGLLIAGIGSIISSPFFFANNLQSQYNDEKLNGNKVNSKSLSPDIYGAELSRGWDSSGEDNEIIIYHNDFTDIDKIKISDGLNETIYSDPLDNDGVTIFDWEFDAPNLNPGEIHYFNIQIDYDDDDDYDSHYDFSYTEVQRDPIELTVNKDQDDFLLDDNFAQFTLNWNNHQSNIPEIIGFDWNIRSFDFDTGNEIVNTSGYEVVSNSSGSHTWSFDQVPLNSDSIIEIRIYTENDASIPNPEIPSIIDIFKTSRIHINNLYDVEIINKDSENFISGTKALVYLTWSDFLVESEKPDKLKWEILEKESNGDINVFNGVELLTQENHDNGFFYFETVDLKYDSDFIIRTEVFENENDSVAREVFVDTFKTQKETSSLYEFNIKKNDEGYIYNSLMAEFELNWETSPGWPEPNRIDWKIYEKIDNGIYSNPWEGSELITNNGLNKYNWTFDQVDYSKEYLIELEIYEGTSPNIASFISQEFIVGPETKVDYTIDVSKGKNDILFDGTTAIFDLNWNISDYYSPLPTRIEWEVWETPEYSNPVFFESGQMDISNPELGNLNWSVDELEKGKKYSIFVKIYDQSDDVIPVSEISNSFWSEFIDYTINPTVNNLPGSRFELKIDILQAEEIIQFNQEIKVRFVDDDGKSRNVLFKDDTGEYVESDEYTFDNQNLMIDNGNISTPLIEFIAVEPKHIDFEYIIDGVPHHISGDRIEINNNFGYIDTESISHVKTHDFTNNRNNSQGFKIVELNVPVIGNPVDLQNVIVTNVKDKWTTNLNQIRSLSKDELPSHITYSPENMYLKVSSDLLDSRNELEFLFERYLIPVADINASVDANGKINMDSVWTLSFMSVRREFRFIFIIPIILGLIILFYLVFRIITKKRRVFNMLEKGIQIMKNEFVNLNYDNEFHYGFNLYDEALKMKPIELSNKVSELGIDTSNIGFDELVLKYSYLDENEIILSEYHKKIELDNNISEENKKIYSSEIEKYILKKKRIINFKKVKIDNIDKFNDSKMKIELDLGIFENEYLENKEK